MPVPLFNNEQFATRQNRLSDDFSKSDFLFQEARAGLRERLLCLNRQFNTILVLTDGDRGQSCVELLRQLYPTAFVHVASPDEDWTVEYELIVTDLILHWVNDLPGFLLKCRHALVSDGLFLGCLLGGSTLTELRDSFLQAELEVQRGASPRVIPMPHLHDMAALMQKAGFALPVVDRDELIVTYENPINLLHDLRNMGEANRMHERRKTFTIHRTMDKMVELYQKNYSVEGARVKATFEPFFLTGWAPSQVQQKPSKRGSATLSLKTTLEE